MARKGICRLPSATRLSQRLGVSRPVVLKAISQLQEEGVLVVRHGLGTFVAAALDPAAPLPARKRNITSHAVNAITDRLLHDILGGRWQPGHSLPGHKQLMEEYGVSRGPLRRALTALVESGTLERSGRKYRTPVLSKESPRNRIVLVTRGSHANRSLHLSPWGIQTIQAIENACMQHGLRLDYRVVSLPAEQTAREQVWNRISAAIAKGSEPLGVACMGFAPALEHLGRIMPASIPLAVATDEYVASCLSWSSLSCPSREFRIHSGFEAGARVGRYLIAKGHTRVAYIAHDLRDRWARDRYEGLKYVYDTAGIKDAVQDCMLQELPDMPELRRIGQRASDLVQELYQTPQFKACDWFERSGATELSANSLSRSVWAQLWRASVAARATCMFDEALKRVPSGAWVASNDPLALFCFHYLRAKDIPPPDPVALVGFDDSPTTHTHNISSYNFGSAAIGHAMVEYLIRPSLWKRNLGRSSIFEAHGAVCSRHTG